ncbi:MAG: 3-oxoacyl-[acyl-carrier-protein] reductase [Bacteroidota bacterium]
MRTLQDKIAVVTGGTRGIGRAIALGLADVGAHVVLTYKSSRDLAEQLVEDIRKKGRRCAAYQSDAARLEEAQTAIDRVIAEFKRIDILVNNAGITRDTLLLRMSELDWDLVLDTNLKSVFNFTKAVCKHMVRQRAGKVVNISSVAGLVGNAGQANYAASKAGIIGFTKSVAKELASRNIQVNVIAPGFVETEMTEKLNQAQKQAVLDMLPMKRTAKPEEIAAAVNFLASADSDYITGQVLCVDGGLVM